MGGPELCVGPRGAMGTCVSMLQMVSVTLCVPNIETSRHLSPELDLHSPGKVLGSRGFGTHTTASANSQPGYLSEKPGASKSQQMDSEP